MIKSEKHFTIMPESEGALLCVEVSGDVTLDAYNKLYVPPILEILQKYGEVRILYYYPDRDKPIKWDEEAAALDFGYTAEGGHQLKKVALVNVPDIVKNRWSVKKAMIGGEARFFEKSDLQEAINWAKS